MVIGITQSDSRFHLYEPWITKGNEDINIITLSYQQHKPVIAAECDGILLTGGVDSHPSFYHQTRIDYPLAPATFNIRRDQFELEVLSIALEKKIPVLGICRGMQIIQIGMGGSMIQDLEEMNFSSHRQMMDKDSVHPIWVDSDSLLYTITGASTGLVNSAHHQGVGPVPSGLKIVAQSNDGVIEAIEWEEPAHKNWMLGVQWHPERMIAEETSMTFSDPIKQAFIQACNVYNTSKK